jgi:hypothetical protein
MRGLLTRTDIIIKKMCPESRKRRIVVATRVDNFDNLLSSGDRWRMEDQITQYARFHEIVGILGFLFKPEADIVGASCIYV